MTVCKYYQQGNCRYGNACRFEHPPKGGNQQQNYNRFGALSGQQNQGMNSRGGAADAPSYPGLTAEVIGRDLRDELPTWILSCYGPGRDAPEQLWGGYPREQSPEEIRLHFMKGQAAGNPQGALNDIQQLYQTAQQQIEHTLGNLPMAIQYVMDGAKKHPNRLDICNQASSGAGAGASSGGGPFGGNTAFRQQSQPVNNPFGAPATPATGSNAFGQPAALGQKPNPFGTPAASTTPFGQPAQQGGPGFGQPSALSNPFGKPAAPGFGQPAALGGSTPFGGAAQPAGAFGQTSALGAKPNPFGAPASSQPSQPAFGQSGFGQPAALGARPNPFAAAAQAGGQGGFAASQATPANNPFGQPAQQPQQNQAAPNPFGQAANNQQQNNPFGQPAQAAANPFGQPSAPGVSGRPNPFGQPQQQPGQPGQQPQQQAANPFGGSLATGPPANPFAAAAAAAQPSAAPNPFANAAQPAPAAGAVKPAPGTGPYPPGSTRQHPDITTYASFNPDKTLRMYKGKPVYYEEPKGGGKPVPCLRNFDGSMVRIWMPNGAPVYTTQTEAPPEKYQDPGVMQQWMAFVETGRFAGGVMPEVPPKREFCTWDF
ncbi:hypothetical protein B0J18DRAFT_296490 [Chaetomium sp. MPI-SDFR-AT-0129]|nr:hypothetical protein B0J18DRAFT_296490 [Chaetomium sp. MPI-SDFR-AT-0129]